MSRPLSHLLGELRVADVATFLAVHRASSVTGAARTLRVTPSQVSKAVARLEALLGAKLLARGGRGVTLTPAAARLVPQLEELVRRVSALRVGERYRELTVAAPSFLNALFLPAIAAGLPSYRLRGIELPPALVRSYATENIFELALTLSREALPVTWEICAIGDVYKRLYAAPSVARRLGRGPIASAQLADVPFVVPIYNHHGQFVIADEGCPIASERRIGHEVSTAALGLELAARTEQLVFAPAPMAAPYVARGELVEIAVRGWDVRETLFVACNSERMLARERTAVIAAIRAAHKHKSSGMIRRA